MTYAASWKRVLEELRTTLRPRIFNTWFRPTVGLAETDDSIAVLVPSRWFILVILRHYLNDIAEAARRAGLPPKRLNFVYTDDNTQPSTAYFVPADGQDPETTQKLLEAIRQALGAPTIRVLRPEELEQVAGGATPIPDPLWEEFVKRGLSSQAAEALAWFVRREELSLQRAEAIIREARKAGVDPDALVAELYREAQRCLARSHPDAKLTISPYALSATFIRQNAGQMTITAPILGEDRAAAIQAILQHPALLIAPQKTVIILVEVEPGTWVEIRREGTRGMSPELAAIFIACVSLALEGSRIRRTSSTGRPALVVERRFIEDILGRPIDDRDIRRMGESLRCAFHLALWRPRKAYLTLDDFRPFRGVRWAEGRRFVHFILDPDDLDRLRSLHPRYDFRFFRFEAVPALARSPRMAAALTLWLAYRFHGSRGLKYPVEADLDQLHRELLGTEAPKDKAHRRRFVREVREAVAWINRHDALAPYGIEAPRYVHLDFRNGRFVFRRTTGPVIDVVPTDPFGAWLRKRTVRDARAETPARDLYADYAAFCRTLKVQPLPRKVWGRRMGERFRRVWRRISGRPTWVWQGVRLREGQRA